MESNEQGNEQTGIPSQYQDVDITTKVDTVDKELLRKGVPCIYVRSDEVQQGKDSSQLHIFRSVSKGKLFAVWGAAQLDIKLRKAVEPGQEVFLRYDGKQPHPTDPMKTVHQWIVAPKVAAPAPAAITKQTSPDELPF